MQQKKNAEFQDHNHPRHFLNLLPDDHDAGLSEELKEALQLETRDGKLKLAVNMPRVDFQISYHKQPVGFHFELAALETKLGTRVSWKIQSITLDEICAMGKFNTQALQEFSDYTQFGPYREHFNLYNPEARSIVDIAKIGVFKLGEEGLGMPEADNILHESCNAASKKQNELVDWLQKELINGKPKICRKCGWWIF